MFYTVYKSTNTKNGKFYIGCHKTTDLNDGYMGSGKYLKAAIKKHGLENFVKEILHVYDTAEEMFTKEKELVYVSEETYNLNQGGYGGWDFVNKSGIRGPSSESQKRAAVTLKHRRQNDIPLDEKMKASALSNLRKAHEKGSSGFLGKMHTDETKKIISAKNKGQIPWNKGIPRSEEDKKKISEGMKKH